jgi:hypothetical protein
MKPTSFNEQCMSDALDIATAENLCNARISSIATRFPHGFDSIKAICFCPGFDGGQKKGKHRC